MTGYSQCSEYCHQKQSIFTLSTQGGYTHLMPKSLCTCTTEQVDFAAQLG